VSRELPSGSHQHRCRIRLCAEPNHRPTESGFRQRGHHWISFHGDFLQGWTNSSVLSIFFLNCFTNDDCPWRQFSTPNGEDGVKTPCLHKFPLSTLKRSGSMGLLPHFREITPYTQLLERVVLPHQRFPLS
jgi:hypothetical protein